MKPTSKAGNLEKLFANLPWIVITVGIILRFVSYLQNRNLIIDEANIVRNLFERDFVGLLSPLSYEQYAPPVFLWIEKVLSLTFGFGEKALKLFPMFCGITMLFLFYDILKRIIDKNIVWIPLALLAFSPYFTEFSTTIKQYISDSFIVLLLVWLALKVDIFKTPRSKFITVWSVAGVLCIASSMPSVFALAAVGFYYGWQSIQQKKWKQIVFLLLIAGIWLGAFAVYYFAILKPQIESNYLQNYHAEYFLYGTPSNAQEWEHNKMRLKELVNNATGYGATNYYVAFTCIIIAVIVSIRKRFDLFILVFTPILITLIAAALNQFSLIMRVSLFLLPLIVLLFAIGMNAIWKIRLLPVKITVVIIGLIMAKDFNGFKLFFERSGFHEITEGLDYVNRKKITSDQLFVHDASIPTYIYYTEIDPNRERYSNIVGAHRMKWSSDYTQETENLTDTTYFLFTGGFGETEKAKRIQQIEQNMKQIDYFEKYICFVYGYVPK